MACAPTKLNGGYLLSGAPLQAEAVAKKAKPIRQRMYFTATIIGFAGNSAQRDLQRFTLRVLPVPDRSRSFAIVPVVS